MLERGRMKTHIYIAKRKVEAVFVTHIANKVPEASVITKLLFKLVLLVLVAAIHTHLCDVGQKQLTHYL
jgi:hypothetical protein